MTSTPISSFDWDTESSTSTESYSMDDAELLLLPDPDDELRTHFPNDASTALQNDTCSTRTKRSIDRGSLSICTTFVSSLQVASDGCCTSKGSLKSVLLVLLVIQGSSAILVGRYTRSAVPDDDLYEIGHLVFVIECIKLLLSVAAEYISSKGRLWESVEEHIWKRPVDSCKVLVPAVLYVIQNSLVYIALSNLSAPVFISLQQGKLIATAIVSVAMLQRTYSTKQWCCLFVLALGVAVVAIDEKSGSKANTNESNAMEEELDAEPEQFFLVGVLAVTGACFSSAFAGVYFEKVLAPEKAAPSRNAILEKYSFEQSSTTTDVLKPQAPPEPATAAPSLWIRNMQLAFFSIIFCLIQGIWDAMMNTRVLEAMSFDDDEASAESGSDSVDEVRPYFHGFTFWVWVLVLLQAAGGLLVAAVMKWADNVLKGLAMGVGVVVASIVSTLLFHVQLSHQFTFGAFIICGSVYCFSNDPPCSKIGT